MKLKFVLLLIATVSLIHVTSCQDEATFQEFEDARAAEEDQIEPSANFESSNDQDQELDTDADSSHNLRREKRGVVGGGGGGGVAAGKKGVVGGAAGGYKGGKVGKVGGVKGAAGSKGGAAFGAAGKAGGKKGAFAKGAGAAGAYGAKFGKKGAFIKKGGAGYNKAFGKVATFGVSQGFKFGKVAGAGAAGGAGEFTFLQNFVKINANIFPRSQLEQLERREPSPREPEQLGTKLAKLEGRKDTQPVQLEQPVERRELLVQLGTERR